MHDGVGVSGFGFCTAKNTLHAVVLYARVRSGASARSREGAAGAQLLALARRSWDPRVPTLSSLSLHEHVLEF